MELDEEKKSCQSLRASEPLNRSRGVPLGPCIAGRRAQTLCEFLSSAKNVNDGRNQTNESFMTKGDDGVNQRPGTYPDPPIGERQRRHGKTLLIFSSSFLFLP